MKKSKKWMLSALALSAFAITTPVILTACSTETTKPGDGTEPPGGGTGGGGNTGGGDNNNGGNNQNWEVENDTNKNKDDWTPTNNKIKELEKAFTDATDGNAGIKAIETILKKDKMYEGVDSDMIKSIIDIWSWNIYKQTQKGAAKDTYKSNLKIDKNTSTPDTSASNKPTKIDIDFTFNASWDNGTNESKNQTKIEKTYKTEADSTISSDGVIKLKSELKTYVVNGEDKLNKSSRYFRNSTNEDKITNTEVSIDIEDTLKLYFDNKNIKAGSTTPKNPEVVHNKILVDNWITENESYKSIYSIALDGFNDKTLNKEAMIVVKLSGASGPETDKIKLGTFDKSFKDADSVKYLAEIYSWIIWHKEKEGKKDFKMDFKVTKNTHTKALTTDQTKNPKIDFDIEITQSWTNDKTNIYIKKTIDFLEQKLPINVAVDDKKTNELKHTITLNQYMENGKIITLKESEKTKYTTMPTISGYNNANGPASYYAKAFYYYLNIVNTKPKTV